MFCHAYRKVTALAIAGLFVIVGNPALADVKNEHKVKAAIVYKLLRYISWPESTLDKTTINLCVDQNDPFFAAFSDVDSRSVHNRKIVLRNHPEQTNAEECQIAFTSADSERDGLLFADAQAKGVLTISDAERFAERGGMIGLVVENNRVRFKINPHVLYQSELRINSSLLRLADIVETDNADEKSDLNLHADSEAFE